jgi:hypothetical protein
MYTLISAIGQPLNGAGRWRSIEIGDMPMTTIYSTYAQVYAILSNPFFPQQVCLNFAGIRSQYGGVSLTFNELLASLGSESLPTTNTLPVINTRYAKYADAIHAGYKIEPIHPTISPTTPIPRAEKTWLLVSRPNTDYNLLYKSCLVSVNGFFHQTDVDATGLYVKDGMESCFISNDNQLGLFSFRELGSLSFIPITKSMVYKQNINQVYRDRCYINVGKDVSNKSVFLVLGGYLHVLDKKTFYRVGNGQFCIDMSNLPLFERYYESKNYIDLTSLPLQKTDKNDNQVAVDEFLSDECLLTYVTLSQSFFVILDNPEIFVEREEVKAAPMPGMFISYTRPQFPLITGKGKLSNYWYTYEDTQYSLTCTDSYRQNRLFNTVHVNSQTSVSDQRVPTDAVRHGQGRYLKIGADL